MYNTNRQVRILIAEDDADDRTLLRDAFNLNGRKEGIQFVHDGQELLNFLSDQKGENELPDLILLDLNMPRKDGREALKEIKNNPLLAQIPVIVMSTSRSEDDICDTYSLGVNSYIIKPSNFQVLVNSIRSLCAFWLTTSTLPSKTEY
jgi:CheY-like chemotaxis protein